MTFETIGRTMETGKLMDMVEVFEGLEDWRNAQQTRHR
jgi:hypothetical protein